MRWREQSQKSTSIARSCLDSSVSLFRHSMKSLSPPWGPSSQMKAHSLGRRSSRCVKPAGKKNKTNRAACHYDHVQVYATTKSSIVTDLWESGGVFASVWTEQSGRGHRCCTLSELQLSPLASLRLVSECFALTPTSETLSWRDLQKNKS